MDARLGTRWSLAVLVIVAMAAMATAGRGQEPENRWAAGVFGIPGVDKTVHAVVPWDDGSGVAMYAGGQFGIAGTIEASGVARWDGARWTPLGGGPDQGISSADTRDGGVYAMALFDDGAGQALYVAGQFETAGGRPALNIARWDGRAWSTVGEGLGAEGDVVESLTVFDDGAGSALYAALTTERGTYSSIVRWDGRGWTTVVGRILGRVRVLAAVDVGAGPRLVAGGSFGSIEGVGAQAIAQWDGRQWSSLGAGLARVVHAAVVFDDGSGPALYAGGAIERSGTTAIVGVARWDGEAWNAVGDLNWGDSLSLHVYDDGSGPALYAGGVNLRSGDLPYRGLLRWDGGSWMLPGGDQLGSWTNALATFDGPDGRELIAAGLMYLDEAHRAAHIARFSGGDWRILGAHLGALDVSYHRAVYALERFDDGGGESLYVGGQFGIDTAPGDGADAFQLARWDGVGWSSVGGGMAPGWPEAVVLALKASDVDGANALYAGGRFTMAAETPANGIARWDGHQWSALGEGLSGGSRPDVYAIEEFDLGSGPALYVGGAFTQAGGAPAAGVARWDGRAWSSVGEGLIGAVYALQVFDDGSGPALYAGGDFVITGYPGAGDLARWDGQRWEPVGMAAYRDGYARTLCVVDLGDGPSLYVGGHLELEQRTQPVGIARWDGRQWLDVGAHGPRGIVRALEAIDLGNGLELVAAGGFTSEGQSKLRNLAHWNGSRWAPLGAGLGTDPETRRRDARALAAFDDGSGPALFVGGDFMFAGGHVSPSIARWSLACAADLDGDGALTVFDFLAFLTLFDAMDPIADFDGDGEFTIFDFLAFQTAFDAGCG